MGLTLPTLALVAAMSVGAVTGASETSAPGARSILGDKFTADPAPLVVGDQSGAIGRRAVTVECIHDTLERTLGPVAQPTAGISAPAT